MIWTLTDLLILLLIFQLSFTSVYLFSKKSGKPIANKLFGFFFLIIALSLADNLLLGVGFWYNHPNFASLTSTFPFLYGPLLYLFTQSIIYRRFALSENKIVHLLPFTIFFIASVSSYEIQPASLKVTFLHNIDSHRISLYFYLGALLMVAHFGLYAFAALALIKKQERVALNKFSTIQRTNLSWLSATIVFFVVLFALALIDNAFEIVSWSGYYTVTLIAVILLLFYFINKVIFKALHDPGFFSWMDDEDIDYSAKKRTPAVLPNRSRELALLSEFMQKQKPYLNAELTIEALAIALQMHPKDLSKLINDHLQQNFFDFVNRYRIREAENLLVNHPDKKVTVLEVLYQCGFNSKSSFNTLFKKYTGTTPTDFKNQHI